MAMARMSVGGATGKAAQLNRVALAWAPLTAAQIQPDSDTYLYVAETGHSIYDGFLAYWRDTGLGEYLGNPVSEEYLLDGVSHQAFERGQLRWSPGEEISMVPVGEKLADQQRLSRDPVGQGDLPVCDEALFIPPPPPAPVPEEVVAAPALSALDPSGERWLNVNLSGQYMVAYQGDTVFLETSINSDRWGFETPTGTFYTNSKFPIQEMIGSNNWESWVVPDVPDLMYFTGKGHAFHGTYWHENFGTPMSHGCIDLPMWASASLYDWAPIGTRVEIHY